MNFADLEVKPLKWEFSVSPITWEAKHILSSVISYAIVMYSVDRYAILRKQAGYEKRIGRVCNNPVAAQEYAQKDYEKQVAKLLFRKKAP